jgi:hypothetical protein
VRANRLGLWLARACGFAAWQLFIIVAAHGAGDSLRSLDTFTVRSSRPITPVIDLKRIEQSVGILEDLNTVLLQKPGVQSIPEANSMLLVNGEGPFDNLYLIRGIPVFPPSNFAGHTYADRSVVTLALPNNISVSASDAYGKWSGASGSVIRIDPCILKTKDRLPRPEGAFSFGTLSTDFSLNVPLRRSRDRYQFSYYVPISYMLRFKSDLIGDSRDLGYGIPADAWNIRTLGEQSIRTLKIQELLWGGTNIYGNDPAEVAAIQLGAGKGMGRAYPWGMAAVSAYDSSGEKPWKLSAGGSRQQYFESRQIDLLTPCKAVERNNCALSFERAARVGTSSSVDIGLLAEYVFWKGSLFIKSDGPGDTVIDMAAAGKSLQVHAGYRKEFSSLQLKINSNQGFFNSGKAPFVDPDVSVGFPALSGSGELSVGLISSPADIRGLPGPRFDRILSRTYHAHCMARQRPFKNVSLDADVFFKYKDRLFLYEDSPLSLAWDIGRKASLVAAGSSFQIDWKAGARIAMHANASVARSRVHENGRRYASDWEIPFGAMTSLSLAIIPEKMNIFCIGTYANGRPYRDVLGLRIDSVFVWDQRQARLPDYKCVDLKWEWRQPADGNLVTEYDGFILVRNVFNWYNVREYKWTPLRTDVSLASVTFNVGLRVNFRMLYW